MNFHSKNESILEKRIYVSENSCEILQDGCSWKEVSKKTLICNCYPFNRPQFIVKQSEK